MTNLAQNLTDTTRAHAGRVAVRVDDAAMTYRALDEASAGVAGLLHGRGFKPGDRVGIMMPNVAEVPVVYYGVLRAGGVVVPMNPLLKAREVAYYLGDPGPGASSPGTRSRTRPAAAPSRPGPNPSSWTGSASPICWLQRPRTSRSRTGTTRTPR